MCPSVVVHAVDHIVAPSPSNNTRKICIWICTWNTNYVVSYTLVCVHFIVCSIYIRLLLFYSVIFLSVTFQSVIFGPSYSVRHFPVLQIPVLQIQLSQKHMLEMSGSTSGATTKDSCMSTALNRWSATEMRWNKNAVSRASPIAALNRRPTSVRKSKEQGAIAPRVSSVIGTKRKLCGDKNTWPPSAVLFLSNIWLRFLWIIVLYNLKWQLNLSATRNL